MSNLILLRHGESEWNKANLFTGWADVDLSEAGREGAKRAGELLRERGYKPGVAFTSYLKRAIRTLWIALDELDLMWIPVHKTWRLNERHYGALQGLDKAATTAQYGEEQVLVWRRAYAVQPPAMDAEDERHAGRQPQYAHVPASAIPGAESLHDTFQRMLPFWIDAIAPELRQGKDVLVAAHGNTLRALVMHLDGLSEADGMELNIPTSEPLVYELDGGLRPERSFYLNDPEEISRAAAAVAAQATGTR